MRCILNGSIKKYKSHNTHNIYDKILCHNCFLRSSATVIYITSTKIRLTYLSLQTPPDASTSLRHAPDSVSCAHILRHRLPWPAAEFGRRLHESRQTCAFWCSWSRGHSKPRSALRGLRLPRWCGLACALWRRNLQHIGNTSKGSMNICFCFTPWQPNLNEAERGRGRLVNDKCLCVTIIYYY